MVRERTIAKRQVEYISVRAAEFRKLKAEVRQLRAQLSVLSPSADPICRSSMDTELPPLPPADAEGYFPAKETLRAILARQIISRRTALLWSQAELAKRSGVRQETVSRLEAGKDAPNVKSVDKIEGAMKKAEAHLGNEIGHV